jgi:hypothetical protein
LTLLKYIIPYYVGIFGSGIGMRILVIATAIRMGVMLVVIFALALFWLYARTRK